MSRPSCHHRSRFRTTDATSVECLAPPCTQSPLLVMAWVLRWPAKRCQPLSLRTRSGNKFFATDDRRTYNRGCGASIEAGLTEEGSLGNQRDDNGVSRCVAYHELACACLFRRGQSRCR